MASFADFQAALDSFQSDVNVEFGKLGAQIDAEVGKANPAQDWQPAIDGVTSLKATVLAGVSALEAKIPA